MSLQIIHRMDNLQGCFWQRLDQHNTVRPELVEGLYGSALKERLSL